MIVTEWRGIARKEGKILTRETQEKKNSSLAQVVMAKFLQFGILFPQLSCQKPFYSQPKWSSAFRRPFLFYHHAYARSMFDLFTNRYHTYSLSRYYLIYPQKLRYRIWLLQIIIATFMSHSAFGLYFNESNITLPRQPAKGCGCLECSVKFENYLELEVKLLWIMENVHKNVECLMRYKVAWSYENVITRWSKISFSHFPSALFM